MGRPGNIVTSAVVEFQRFLSVGSNRLNICYDSFDRELGMLEHRVTYETMQSWNKPFDSPLPANVICMICLEPILPTRDAPHVVMPCCGAYFHKACIELALVCSSTCPHCRNTVEDINGVDG